MAIVDLPAPSAQPTHQGRSAASNPCRSASCARRLRRGCVASRGRRPPLVEAMPKQAQMPALASRNKSSFATCQWPLPPCSRRPAPEGALQRRPKDATSLRPAVLLEHDTSLRSPAHRSPSNNARLTKLFKLFLLESLKHDHAAAPARKQFAKLAAVLNAIESRSRVSPESNTWRSKASAHQTGDSQQAQNAICSAHART